MVKLITAEAHHLDSLELKEVFEHKDAIIYGKLHIGNGTPAITITDEGGKVLGVIGGTFLFPGVMEAFGLFSDDIKKHKVSFHKRIKEVLEMAFSNYKVHRIQMVVRSDYFEGQAWAEALGFTYEGTMVKYGPTMNNYHLYARTV